MLSPRWPAREGEGKSDGRRTDDDRVFWKLLEEAPVLSRVQVEVERIRPLRETEDDERRKEEGPHLSTRVKSRSCLPRRSRRARRRVVVYKSWRSIELDRGRGRWTRVNEHSRTFPSFNPPRVSHAIFAARSASHKTRTRSAATTTEPSTNARVLAGISSTPRRALVTRNARNYRGTT